MFWVPVLAVVGISSAEMMCPLPIRPVAALNNCVIKPSDNVNIEIEARWCRSEVNTRELYFRLVHANVNRGGQHLVAFNFYEKYALIPKELIIEMIHNGTEIPFEPPVTDSPYSRRNKLRFLCDHMISNCTSFLWVWEGMPKEENERNISRMLSEMFTPRKVEEEKPSIADRLSPWWINFVLIVLLVIGNDMIALDWV